MELDQQLLHEQIAQFQAITDCPDPEVARRLLERYRGDLETAVGTYMDLQQRNASEGTPNENQTREKPQKTASVSFLKSIWNRVLRVWPVQVLIRSLYQLYHMNAMRPARYLIESVFQPSEISKWSPHLAASKLSRYLDTRYAALASQRVQLFDGPYSQALAAAKRDLKYLLVYLHAPDHDDTDEFCRTVLCSTQLRTFAEEKECIVWAGNIYHTEAFQVGNILDATAYPFLALICQKDGRMQVIDRLPGFLPIGVVLQRLETAAQNHGMYLAQARLEQQERDADRRIREEQDRAYQESLRLDREKEEKLRKEREKAQKEAEQQERAIRDLERKQSEKLERRAMLLSTLPAEPTEGTDLVKIVFRLPDGSRLDRKFRESDKVELLYHFTETLDLNIESETFQICSNFPRVVLKRSTEQTLRDAGLSPKAMLVVEEVWDG